MREWTGSVWKQRLMGVEPPDPFDLESFCAALARARGRALHLESFHQSVPGGPCGLWARTELADFIFFETHTGVLHQEHIILHELGHMLCDHGGDRRLLQGLEESKAGMLGVIDGASVQEALGRTTYSDWQEQEAEEFARMMGAHRSRTLQAARQAADPDGSSAFDRAAGVFSLKR